MMNTESQWNSNYGSWEVLKLNFFSSIQQENLWSYLQDFSAKSGRLVQLREGSTPLTWYISFKGKYLPQTGKLQLTPLPQDHTLNVWLSRSDPRSQLMDFSVVVPMGSFTHATTRSSIGIKREGVLIESDRRTRSYFVIFRSRAPSTNSYTEPSGINETLNEWYETIRRYF